MEDANLRGDLRLHAADPHDALDRGDAALADAGNREHHLMTLLHAQARDVLRERGVVDLGSPRTARPPSWLAAVP